MPLQKIFPEVVLQPIPLPPSLAKGRGSKVREGVSPPLYKSLPPRLAKERGTQGARLRQIKNK
jgi:hypothetical protein